MSFKSIEQSVVGLTSSVFGEVCQYTPNGSAPVSITGIFNNAYVEIEGVISLKPTLRINLADLSNLPDQGDQVVVDLNSYMVVESRPDGHGGSTLILKLS